LPFQPRGACGKNFHSTPLTQNSQRYRSDPAILEIEMQGVFAGGRQRQRGQAWSFSKVCRDLPIPFRSPIIHPIPLRVLHLQYPGWIEYLRL